MVEQIYFMSLFSAGARCREEGSLKGNPLLFLLIKS